MIEKCNHVKKVIKKVHLHTVFAFSHVRTGENVKMGISQIKNREILIRILLHFLLINY